MTSTSSIVRRALGLLGSSLFGCGLVVSGEELGDGGGVEADILEYEALVESLDAECEQALDGEAVAVMASGAWLAWIEGSSLGLRRYPDELELELATPSFDYRLGDAHVLTRDAGDLGVVYRGFALPGGELIDEQPMTEVASAFALFEDVALVLDGGTLWRWRLGLEAPIALGVLLDLSIEASEVAAFEALDVERVLIHADDRLWLLELSSFTVTQLAELDELLAAAPRGALLHRDDGLYLHEFDGGSIRIDAAIAASGWSLNPTFASIHEYSGDGATLFDDRVVYIGPAGVFTYSLDETGPSAIEPILIEPRWDVGAGIPRIEYREPKAAGDRVFVRGLVGESGQLGETGPIWVCAY